MTLLIYFGINLFKSKILQIPFYHIVKPPSIENRVCKVFGIYGFNCFGIFLRKGIQTS